MTSLSEDLEMALIGLNQYSIRAHRVAKEHGWWDEPRTVGDTIALMHSELSEALEAYRDNDDLSHTYYREGDGKPEGVVYELADCIIRIFDFCEYHDLPIANAVTEKMEFNDSRPHRHGGKNL